MVANEKKSTVARSQDGDHPGVLAVYDEMMRASPGLRKWLWIQTGLLLAGRSAVALGAVIVARAVDSAQGEQWAWPVGAASAYGLAKVADWALSALHGRVHAARVLPCAFDFCDAAILAALERKGLEGDPTELARRLDRKSEARAALGFLFHHIFPPAAEILLCAATMSAMGFGPWGWALIPAACCHMWIASAMAPKIRAAARLALGKGESASSAATEALECAGLAKAYGTQKELGAMIASKSGFERAEHGRQSLASDAALAAQNLALAAWAAAFFAAGLAAVGSGAATPGAFAALVGVAASCFGQLRSLAFAFDGLIGSAAALGEHVEHLRAARDPAMRCSFERQGAGTLEIKGWRAFRAGAEVVHIDRLALAPGEKLFLAGASGAGKSTLLLSLMGMCPSEGSMRWGSQAWNPDAGGVCAYMPQGLSGLGSTIERNLALGRAEASAIDMWAALDEAGLREKVERMGGLGAELGRRGATLSGGESQRLSLARAFVSNLPLLLLDEPTSGLDATSEARAIAALMAKTDRGAIICAHRIRSIPPGSRVALMESGRIVEDGPIEELIAAGKGFSKLWADSQARPSVDEAEPGERG